MTMEEFLNSTPDDIKEAVSKLENVNELSDEISSLEEEINEIERQLSAVKDEINAWLDDFNNNISNNLSERAVKLKDAYEQKISDLKTKNEELETKKEEYEEIVNNVKKQKQREKISSVIKNNLIKIDKSKGIKTTKKVAKTVAALGVIAVVKTTDKFKEIASKVKENTIEAKEWAKEDLKKGVGYKTAEIIKEKAPEVVDNIKETVSKVKIKIDKTKSSITKVPKKAISGVRNAFSKISIKTNGIKKVVVSKSTRLYNRIKDSVSNEVEYLKEANDINKQKREQLEAYRKQLEEEARLMKEQARAKTGKSL